MNILNNCIGNNVVATSHLWKNLNKIVKLNDVEHSKLNLANDSSTTIESRANVMINMKFKRYLMCYKYQICVKIYYLSQKRARSLTKNVRRKYQSGLRHWRLGHLIMQDLIIKAERSEVIHGMKLRRIEGKLECEIYFRDFCESNGKSRYFMKFIDDSAKWRSIRSF